MRIKWISAVALMALFLSACGKGGENKRDAASSSDSPSFIFGMLLVGPYNDRGWSQAHFEAGRYVEANCPGAKMVYVDKVNPADRPGSTPAQLAEDLLSKGARLVIFNSDDMKDDCLAFARKHPDVFVVHASGDHAWKEGKDYKGLPNLINVMGRIEYAKMIAGFAAALATQTGRIGYLGPLINDETRRLAASAYLGARYAWTHHLKRDPKDLVFRVTWIGFWFNIPGVTADPSQAADEFFNSGFDVIISGIDTTEALVQARKMAGRGRRVFALPYDYKDACTEAPEVCLGAPYFNWGPAYVEYVRAAQQGRWTARFDWFSPYWPDINDPDRSAVGFAKGSAMSAEIAAQVDAFSAELAGGLNLWRGPLNLQDGTTYVKEGETATDQQIWYLPQLLEGMEGQSVPGAR